MKKKILTISLSFVIIIGIILFALIWNGKIILNNRYAKEYSVKGIDISAYQGEIDWDVISGQDISFVFIKATEGSSFVDEKFAYNFEQAQKTSLDVGAYHFFSYDSNGETQAENFIKNEKAFRGMLPPVINLEFFGDKE